MTRDDTARYADSPLRVECPQCSAARTAPCTTPSGKIRDPHERRYLQAKTVWLEACDRAAAYIVRDLGESPSPVAVARHPDARRLTAGLTGAEEAMALDQILASVDDLRR